MNFHLTLKSGNSKTGPIPVVIASKDTCPSCPWKEKMCYARYSYLGMWWERVTQGDPSLDILSWKELCDRVRTLIKPMQIWRYAQAGDLPGKKADNELIHVSYLRSLIKANHSKRGFTYTHRTGPENAAIIKEANDKGFTINLSANNLAEVDTFKRKYKGIPLVVTLPPNTTARTCTTPKGFKVITCPATYRDNVTCSTCKLCAIPTRLAVIGFPAHGTGKKYYVA